MVERNSQQKYHPREETIDVPDKEHTDSVSENPEIDVHKESL